MAPRWLRLAGRSAIAIKNALGARLERQLGICWRVCWWVAARELPLL
jgi:hypothetical protein